MRESQYENFMDLTGLFWAPLREKGPFWTMRDWKKGLKNARFYTTRAFFDYPSVRKGP